MSEATAVPVCEVNAVEAPRRPTVHALPRNLGRLAEHTARDGGRFCGMTAVKVAFAGDTFTVEATDAVTLVRVSGPTVVKAEDFPLDALPELASAPNGAAAALVPAAAWKRAFVGAKKLRKAARAVGVVTGETVTTFGATDGAAAAVETAVNAEGRYPPTDDILSMARKAETKAVFRVDAARLAALLKTIAAVGGGDAVDVTFHVPARAGKPILLTATAEGGAEVTAIVQPLSDRN
jgi:hypothetical protein